MEGEEEEQPDSGIQRSLEDIDPHEMEDWTPTGNQPGVFRDIKGVLWVCIACAQKRVTGKRATVHHEIFCPESSNHALRPEQVEA